MTSHEVAALLFDIEAVAVNMEEPFRYTSGLLSPIYCDNRLIISYPDKRDMIAQAFVDLIQAEGMEYDTIGGPATGAIPHSAFVAQKLNCPMIYIRGKAKEHGKKKQVEGKMDSGARVLIIEDLVSTGGSSLAAIEGVRNEGGVVTDCISIMTYQMKSSIKGFAAAQVNLRSLTTFTDVVAVAVERGVVTEEQRERVLDWNQDPDWWGKKMGLE